MTKPQSEENDGYAGRAVAGAAWQGAVNIGIRALRAVVFVVLARILTPDDFGLVALAMVFVMALQYLSGAGLSSSIVHVRDLTKSHLDTAFWFGATIGFSLSVGLAASAGAVSSSFAQPGLEVVLYGLAVMPLLSGVTMVPEGLLSRELEFRSLSIRHILAAVVSVTLALVLAFGGAGVWALVAQTVGEAVVSFGALWVAMRGRYRVGTTISRESARDILPFSANIVGGNMTVLVSTRGDDLLIGAFLGPIALGLYSVAYRLLTILQEAMLNVSANVAFPLLTKLRDEQDRLMSGFHRASRLIFTIAAPVYLFLGLASSPIISLALGSTWLSAASTMTALAFAGVAATIIDTNNIFLQSIGRPGRALALSVSGALVNILGFLLVVRHGIFWVALAFAVRGYLFIPISLWQAGKWAGGFVTMVATYVRMVPSLLICCAGALAVEPLAQSWGTISAVLILGIATSIAYVGTVRLVSRSVYDDLARLASSALPGRRVRAHG